MFEQSGIQILLLVAVFVAAALFTVQMNRSRHKWDAEQELQYVWLAIIGPSNAESTEDTYKSAYLLLAAGLRMELMMSEFLQRSHSGLTRARSRFSNAGKIAYSTEGFQPHIREISSLKTSVVTRRTGETWE